MKYLIIALSLFCTSMFAQSFIVKTSTTTIDSAASVTDTLDIYDFVFDTEMKLVGIEVDTPWTAANLTFLVQADPTAVLAEMQEMDGTAVTCTVDSTFNNYFALKPTLFAGIRFFQIRSGTRGTPVAQGDARTIKLFFRKY